LNMRLLTLLCSLLTVSSFTTNDYNLIKSIPLHASFFTTDNLGNAYVVENNELKKYDPSGKLLSNYSEKNLGTLKFVDVGNPLKIILFYPDFQQINILDSKLLLESTIQLR